MAVGHKVEQDETESVEDFFDAEDSPPVAAVTTTAGNFDEAEFVMIDHPQEQGDAVANQDPFLTEKQSKNNNVAEIVTPEPVEKTSPFDAVFGVGEEEPVMVNSFTDESLFTNSTNSSTHRVAPTNKSSKKPPAPPPQQRNKSKQQQLQQQQTTPAVDQSDFDAIFGTHNETIVSDTNTSSQVTPNAKTVPSDQSNHKEVISKGEQGGVGVKEEHENTSATKKKGEKKKKKNIVSWAKSFGGFDFSSEDNKKKKEKKKGKEVSPSPPKAPVTTKSQSPVATAPPPPAPVAAVAPPKKTSVQNATSEPPAPINNNSIPAFDLDTIQGSHIAELVNMGFEPAAALEALDRYDQDLVKATNYLLDQFN